MSDLAKMTAWGRGLEHDKRLLQEENARLKAEVERLTKGHSTDFVRAEMYRHLLDENAKLKEEVMRMRNDDYKEGDILQKCCEHQKNRIERLKAEVERLQSIHSIDSIAIEQLKAEVERLTTWQPMETAPLDGTDVLCVCLDPEFEGEDNPNRYIRTCFFGLMTEDYRCWMSVFGYEENPTHWMPLPAAHAKEDRP